MTKILSMTSSRSQTDPASHAADPLEPTQPLSPRSGNTPFPLPMPIVRPWYPAALVLGPRSQDVPHVA